MTRRDRWLASGLLALAVGMAANAIAGPLLAGTITYPFSANVRRMAIGLDAVSLLVVAPLCVLSAVLIARGRRSGFLLAIPPSAYAVYTFAQFVVGPQYVTYSPAVVLHLGLFVLGGAILLRAWDEISTETLPALGRRRALLCATGLVVLAAFASLNYLASVPTILSGDSIPAMYADDPTVYWSIFLLDLGVVVPATLATAIGLLQGKPWASKALYGAAGWYTLVIGAVAAMFLVMFRDGDPAVSVGTVLVLAVVVGLVSVFAGWVWRPVLGDRGG